MHRRTSVKKLLIIKDDIHISEMVVDYLRGKVSRLYPCIRGNRP